VSAGTAEEDHDAGARAGEGGLEETHGQRHRGTGGAQRPPVVLDRPGVALQLLQDRLQRELDLRSGKKEREGQPRTTTFCYKDQEGKRRRSLSQKRRRRLGGRGGGYLAEGAEEAVGSDLGGGLRGGGLLGASRAAKAEKLLDLLRGHVLVAPEDVGLGALGKGQLKHLNLLSV
jgi:hypothetical protein